MQVLEQFSIPETIVVCRDIENHVQKYNFSRLLQKGKTIVLAFPLIGFAYEPIPCCTVTVVRIIRHIRVCVP